MPEMKRARVKPFLGRTIVHPGALEAWFARVDDRANAGNTGTHEPVSNEKPSSTFNQARGVEVTYEQ
jgi:hypothetical protein